MSAKLITWGAHPSYGGTWIKLHPFSGPKNRERLRLGWELAFCTAGEAPAFLPVGPQIVRAELAAPTQSTRCEHL